MPNFLLLVGSLCNLLQAKHTVVSSVMVVFVDSIKQTYAVSDGLTVHTKMPGILVAFVYVLVQFHTCFHSVRMG